MRPLAHLRTRCRPARTTTTLSAAFRFGDGRLDPRQGRRDTPDLAAVLGTAVDAVDLDRADIELRGRVAERGRRLFSGDEARRVRFEVDARLRWIEFRPVVRDTTRAYLRRVAAAGLRVAIWCRRPRRSASTWPIM